MKLQLQLLRFLATIAILTFAIFIMAIVIFYILKVVAFHCVGGEFLFSYDDVLKSLKISLLCGPMGGGVIWFSHWYSSRNN
ncbi:hypothetical protein [Pseudomonas graminis]